MTRKTEAPGHSPAAQGEPTGRLPALTMFGGEDAPVCTDGWCDIGTPTEGVADGDQAAAEGD